MRGTPKDLSLRSKVFQDLREGIHTKHDESHASVIDLQDTDIDQIALVQFDFDPTDMVCSLQGLDRAA
jgi:hypothetical protein